MHRPVDIYREPERLKNRFPGGHTFSIARNLPAFLTGLVNQHGSVVTTNFLGRKYFILQDPECIKHVLLQNHKTICKPGATKILKLFLGEGLSTSNGELWLRQRRIMQPAFHKQRLEKLADVINEETSMFVDRLKKLPDGTMVNMSDEFLQLTISVISRAMFGIALKDKMEQMVQALESLAAYASAWMKSIVKIPLHWPTSANKSFNANCKIFDDIIYGIIEERQKANPGRGGMQGDLLDMLLEYAGDEDEQVSLKQLRDEVATMFMAGHETTAQTLSWVTYYLSKDTSIHSKIKAETEAFLKEEKVHLENLQQLVYTKQVINETLRCYPPVWAFVRKPLYEDVIDGVQIPALSNLFINVYGIHRHPLYWEKPNDFYPGHFDVDAVVKRPAFAYVPFGGGPRLCIGNNFAMMVMQIVTAHLVRHFSFEIPENYEPIVDPNVTLRAKDGIRLIIHRAK